MHTTTAEERIRLLFRRSEGQGLRTNSLSLWLAVDLQEGGSSNSFRYRALSRFPPQRGCYIYSVEAEA